MTHPLNDAITIATFSGTFPEIRKNHPQRDRFYLSILIRRLGDTACGIPTTDALAGIATGTNDWLLDLGISDPWQAMCDEYDRAKAKHGDMTLDSDKPTNEQRFFAVVEEIGEIARALTYDQDHAGELTKEITQLGALALAWLTHELEKKQK